MEKEKERKRGRTHPDSERIPSTHRMCVCECTNPIIDENNTNQLKDHLPLRPYRLCKKICINASQEYLRAIRRLQHTLEGPWKESKDSKVGNVEIAPNFPPGSISKNSTAMIMELHFSKISEITDERGREESLGRRGRVYGGNVHAEVSLAMNQFI